MELAPDDRQGQALWTLGERGKEQSEKTAAAKFIFALKVALPREQTCKESTINDLDNEIDLFIAFPSI